MTPGTSPPPGYVAGTWTIDPGQSTVAFTIRHPLFHKVRGTFGAFTGERQERPTRALHFDRCKSLGRSRLPTQRVRSLALALVFVPMGPAGILHVLDAVTLNRTAADGDER